MKTNEEKRKSNLWFMLLVVLLISVILCISSFGIATWARYRSVTGSNVEAQIAKWSFKVNGEEEQFANINLADTIDFTHVTTDKIAPGTYGSFDLDIDARGSEVSLDYYININVDEKPTNLKFYSDSTHTTLIPISADNKIYLDGEFLLGNTMREVKTIYWNWDYRTEILPSTSVLQGYYSSIDGLELLVNEYNANGITAEQKQELVLKINDKIDTYEAGGNVLLEVSVKGVQINPSFSLKRVQITSGKDQTYDVGDSVNLSLEFTENVYGDNGQNPVINSNAPEVTLAFGGASASNPVAKVASLMNTNLKLSAGENVATFASVNGNKINYTYTIKSTDIGALRIAGITGSVYNRDGKEINFGTVQAPAIPEVTGGTISAQVELAPNSNSNNQSISSAELGQYVDIGTELLDIQNIVLEDGTNPQSDWRIFKKEEDGIWLILADYLTQDKLPSGLGFTLGTSPYCVTASSKDNLLSILESSEWKKLIQSNSNLYNNSNVIVKGAITKEEWESSWNTDTDYGNVNSSSIGYDDTLYFPRKTTISRCVAYWLDSEYNGGNLWNVNIWGQIAYNLSTDDTGVRPVIFVPNSAVSNITIIPKPAPLPITEVSTAELGQYVDLGTNILNLKSIKLSDKSHPLSDWRVFKKESNGVWLMLSFYLPQSQIPENTGLQMSTEPYAVNTTTNRVDFLNALNNESAWKNLISSNSSLYNNSNVRVRGATDIVSWVNSWNSNEGYTTLYAPIKADVMGDGLNGYYLGDTSNTTSVEKNISGNIGYDDTLYFPVKSLTSGCYSYWIASPSAAGDDRVIDVSHDARINQWKFHWNDIGIRPVVFIPNNL